MFSIWHALHCGALNFDMSAVLCVWPCSMLAYWQVYFGAQFGMFCILACWCSGMLALGMFCFLTYFALWQVYILAWHFGMLPVWYAGSLGNMICFMVSFCILACVHFDVSCILA